MTTLLDKERKVGVVGIEDSLLESMRSLSDEEKSIPSYVEMNCVERRILKEAKERKVCYHDLLNATKATEWRYKKRLDKEKYYHDKVVNHSEHLWGIAYHMALFAKAAKWERWPDH